MKAYNVLEILQKEIKQISDMDTKEFAIEVLTDIQNSI